MVEPGSLHRSNEMEDLTSISKEEMVKPFDNSETKPRRALLVIDIQNDYFPGGQWTLHQMERAAENAAQILSYARSHGYLIIFVRHEFPTADAPFFQSGSHGAQIHSKVQNQADEIVITKNQINAFHGTNLKTILEQNAIEEVVICGAMSHMCIDGVTRAAHDYGYKVVLIEDACATKDLQFNGIDIPAEQVHAAFMAALSFAYAKTIPTKEFLSH